MPMRMGVVMAGWPRGRAGWGEWTVASGASRVLSLDPGSPGICTWGLVRLAAFSNGLMRAVAVSLAASWLGGGRTGPRWLEVPRPVAHAAAHVRARRAGELLRAAELGRRLLVGADLLRPALAPRRVNVVLPSDLAAAVEREAEIEGRSLPNLGREILQDALTPSKERTRRA
jgi:hypothetical protein